ncbi:MAG: glycosyltransferase [Candidatus Zixiibacteriota bacterium]
MQAKKRLLIITNRYPTGPDDIASPFVHDFRLALARGNIAVDIVTPYYRGRSEDTSYIDSTVHTFKWSDGLTVISQLPLYHPASVLKIKRYFSRGFDTGAELLEKNKYDAILALWAAPAGYIAYKLSQKYNIPYAVWALGSDINTWAQIPLVGNIIRKVLKGADQLYADGYELAMKVQALSDAACKFIPSYHAINITAPRANPVEKRFICIGRVEKNRGIFDLLEAFLLFAGRQSGWKLDYVGTGRDEQRLKEKIKEYQLDDSVTCRGYMPRNQINEMLANSMAAVIPTHSDSLPLTFGEAMQAGVPVICSDVGDLPYFIDIYKVGCHYPVGDVKAFAGRMGEMALQFEHYAYNCRSVLAELDIKNSVRAIDEWLESVRVMNNRVEFGYADA